MALAAVPSALLIAVTAHLSTDIAPSPFLWVIPLALYLADLRDRVPADAAHPHDVVVLIQPVLLVALVATIVLQRPRLPAVGDAAARGGVLRHRAGVPRRACAPPAGRRPSHLVLHVDVRRRRDRRRLRRTDRAAIYSPGWPNIRSLIVLAILCRPGLRMRQPRAESAGRARCSRLPPRSSSCRRRVTNTESTSKTFYWSLGALLVLALAASRLREPARLRGASSCSTFMVWRFYEVELDRVRSFFGVHKIVGPRRRRARAAARHDHSWRRTPERRRGRARRPAAAIHLFSAESATVQTIAARARARRRPDQRRDRRARRRHFRLLRRAGRQLDLLRDRSGGGRASRAIRTASPISPPARPTCRSSSAMRG